VNGDGAINDVVLLWVKEVCSIAKPASVVFVAMR